MAAILLLPFFLIRFGLLSCLSKKAVQRAAHFAPVLGKERAAYWLYQLSNAALLVSLFFLKVVLSPGWLFLTGAAVYAVGALLLTLSVFAFAAPSENGLQQTGLYRFSRNPMYVSYFLFFLGCALLAQSLPYLLFLVVFQLSAHWIILSEERYCLGQFGDAYARYMKKVRRYL